jgi:uncharacterized damage-inducible protein DinB
MPLSTSITTRLEYQHKTLIDLIDSLSDEQIRKQVITGKWSIFENIVHLSTYQHAFMQRIYRVKNEDNPGFERYTAEADPLFHDNCLKTTREVIQDLIQTRREIISGALVLKDPVLFRTGTHPVYGKMNICEWLNFFLLHESHHLFTIFKLTAELKKAQYGIVN